MKEYQQRVVEEKKVLDEKLRALKAFLAGQPVLAIRPEERSLMMWQANVMERYSNILHDRIEFFQEQDRRA